MGNPRYVVTSRPSDPVRHGYSLHYTKQNALWLVVKAEWEVQGGAVINERRSRGGGDSDRGWASRGR
ncbi:MAG: hypothetical protein U1A27_10020 [Phycisphaerae bacterium]